MTPTIAELLLMFPILCNVIKAPKPPEIYDYHTLRYLAYADESYDNSITKIGEAPVKSEEVINTNLGSDADDDADEDTTETIQKKTIYTMTESELNALSLKQKAKLLHMNKKTFKTFVKLVNRESGPKMQDKILVAAVVWNRKYCKQYPDTIKKVMYQGGQFTMRGQKKTVIHGNVNDKKAQLAILLAYWMVHTNQIPHNVMNFNSISYRQGSPSRFKRYKHYNNYFLKDTRCHCKWCSECS